MLSWKAPAYNTNYSLTSLVLQECLGAFMGKLLLKGYPGWLSSTSSSHCWISLCRRLRSEGAPRGCRSCHPNQHQGCLLPTRPPTLHCRRHWVGSPSEPCVWVLSHSSAAELVSRVRYTPSACSASWGTRGELNHLSSVHPVLSAQPPSYAHKTGCGGLSEAGWEVDTFLY